MTVVTIMNRTNVVHLCLGLILRHQKYSSKDENDNVQRCHCLLCPMRRHLKCDSYCRHDLDNAHCQRCRCRLSNIGHNLKWLQCTAKMTKISFDTALLRISMRNSRPCAHCRQTSPAMQQRSYPPIHRKFSLSVPEFTKPLEFSNPEF